MTRTASPLRYPGGKSSLARMVTGILRENKIDRGLYVEPFAGGGGLALTLLFRGDVGEILLNDIDPAIAALWRSMLKHSDDLIELIRSTPITIDERQKQRSIYMERPKCDVSLGFAALFLNRVNRSGIIKTGGVIGGLAQTGKYLIDCRFNREDLEDRIRRIARYSSRISFSSLDAGDFLLNIQGSLPSRTLIYADPPYFDQGTELYTTAFRPHDHANFRDKLINIKKPWILTYDNNPQIRLLYAAKRQYQFNINYSAQTKRVGSELLVVSDALSLSSSIGLQQILPHNALTSHQKVLA